MCVVGSSVDPRRFSRLVIPLWDSPPRISPPMDPPPTERTSPGGRGRRVGLMLLLLWDGAESEDKTSDGDDRGKPPISNVINIRGRAHTNTSVAFCSNGREPTE